MRAVTSPAVNQVLELVDSSHEQHDALLTELLRIPSISADSKFAPDVRRAAQWIADHFLSLGLAPELIETPGHPIVYAETPPVPGAPVALVYGHYDVQPPDPLDKWITPPFEPTVRNGAIFARGATDDKGQMLTHVHSVAAWLKTHQQLPLQVKFLIEGEEEVGSDNLDAFLADNVDKLACDCVVISDTSQFAPGVPAITYGLRGIAYCEIFLTGPDHDLHSGVFGGGVTNPAIALCKMLSAIIDADGRIQLPGFYDDVVPLSEREREEFRSLPFDETAFKKDIGVTGLTGEVGYTTLERRWARPTFDICGLTSGYQGEGAKTVLPSRASAKFSFRLVPNQDPQKILAGLKQLLEPLVPPGITMEPIDFHGAPGIVIPLESPYLEAAADAIEVGFGKRPVFMREGGSIPIVNNFAQRLDADVLLLGWGQNDDNLHSPNEKFTLADYHRGIRASSALWDALAKVTKGQSH
jgi:succinyl-diaminopimelate desuccinylase